MLETYMPHLIKDLELGDVSLKSKIAGAYEMPLDENLIVTLSEAPGGITLLRCLVALYPTTNEEAFASRAMLGNLFGQGTRGAVLGLTLDGKNLTLRRIIDYHVEYKEFKEILEDFINMVDYWRNEVLNHK